MTPKQEDALYDFLDNVTEPFTLEQIAAYVQMHESKRNNRLSMEIAALINTRNLAFKLDSRQWLSRRGCFEPVVFVIKPSRLELLNGILIPGHRCLPFANPNMLPHQYEFYWQDKPIPMTTTEGPPEDFYPYYCVYGEEYAPQYVARDNPENEAAFNCDPYEDPPEVSIHTLDMRNIYRESAFVPGDCFSVRTLDWKTCRFALEKTDKDEWSQTDLYSWFEAAEGGFEDSFALLGPGVSTEEQIAYAYWYGGKRMREIPAYSLEEFLYEKTDRIETVSYGIETRFWFAGKEIPDSKGLEGSIVPPDRTKIEDMLFKKNIPVSEYVILSYVRDALFRNEHDIDLVINRIAPPVIRFEESEWNTLADYITEAMDELGERYSLFLDQAMGPVRQRVAELHTAVIELAARLQKGEHDLSWLPRHTFIVLSQIQGHAASLLEDLDSSEAPPESELEAMENSLDSMIDTYDDVKEMIDNAMHNFRRNNLVVVRGGKDDAEGAWNIIQFSVSGVDVWRRLQVDGKCTLEKLRRMIQIGLDWKDSYASRFISEKNGSMERKQMEEKTRIVDLAKQGISEMLYEYGSKWTVKVILLSSYKPAKDEVVRFVAGAGAAPPEAVSGPLRFRRILAALETGSDMEKRAALHELGSDFVPGFFDMDRYNQILNSAYPVEK
jgi:hypothetical protein